MKLPERFSVTSDGKPLLILDQTIPEDGSSTSAIKFVREVYSECEIICCDVHRQRGIQKSQQKTGLLPYINADEEVQSFNRYLWVLTYVPISDILKVYEEFILPKLP